MIVDDMELNRDLLSEILEEEYTILTAGNGKQAMDALVEKHDEIALMLLDLVMPEMDGFAVLNELKKYPWAKSIGVVIISGDTAVQTEAACFDLGVADFVHKPFNNRLVRRRVSNLVGLFQTKEELEQKVEKQTGVLRKQFKLLEQQAEQLRQNKENIIDILDSVVEYRNLESGEHIKRVKGYTRILANKLLEDGKISIPDAILQKPGKLTEEEFEYMKSHTTKGCEILNGIENAWDEEYGRVSYEICRHHHERYDGKGYPDGLKGEDIPISAQIVSIADVYDALVNERVYKSAFSKEKAFQMIVAGECGMFSPKLLDSFWKTRKAFELLSEKDA